MPIHHNDKAPKVKGTRREVTEGKNENEDGVLI
jgi:hypothetical protein